MLVVLLIYNAILVAGDLAVVKLLRRNIAAARWATSLFVAFVAIVILAAVMAVDVFAFFCLLSFGLFGHLPFLLLSSAVPLWRVSKALAIVSGVTAMAIWAVAIDAFLIEPAWIEITHVELNSEKIARPIRIVLLADIQTDRFGDHERRAFRLAMDQKPDLLLLAGDYAQCRDAQTRQQVQGEINRMLKSPDMSDGVHICAVSGNNDDKSWRNIFAGVRATAADSTTTLELDEVRITCLGFEESCRIDLTVKNHQPQRYHVVLGHSPDFSLGRVEADLLLAGHTHGGQVRLPFVGPVLTLSRVPRSRAAGMSELSSGARLIVSRGIGMERGNAPRLRFLCRPEIVVIDLLPSESSQ